MSLIMFSPAESRAESLDIIAQQEEAKEKNELLLVSAHLVVASQAFAARNHHFAGVSDIADMVKLVGNVQGMVAHAVQAADGMKAFSHAAREHVLHAASGVPGQENFPRTGLHRLGESSAKISDDLEEKLFRAIQPEVAALAEYFTAQAAQEQVPMGREPLQEIADHLTQAQRIIDAQLRAARNRTE